jgi:hypothetical protein
MTINTKVQKRLQEGIKKFQPIINLAKTKDINESDTVVIITDILQEVLGYDKYTEITSEYAIKKTFCDIAIKINGKARILIECKAIGLELKDDYIRQATDYGCNSGIDWIILTNGANWRIYKIAFTKPIDKELVYEFDFTNLNYKSNSDLELLFYIAKEALSKSSLEDFYSQKQALSRFYIGQIILTDEVINSIRRILKLLSPDLKTDNDTIRNIIFNEVLKREIVEGEKTEDAKKKVGKAIKKQEEKRTKNIIKTNENI